jgi:hypothetical protein
MSKGIDVVIDKQVAAFTSYLWTANSCSWFGGTQPDYRPEGTFASYLLQGNEYRDVLLDDTKDVICFFDPQPERTTNPDRAIVDIYFAVKLDKLYPSVIGRASEYALADAVGFVKQCGIFTVEKIIDGYESWKDYSMTKKEDNLHPFYLFRLRTNVDYVLTC